jgi:hypothetical protein
MYNLIILSFIITQISAISLGPVVVTHNNIGEWEFYSQNGIIGYDPKFQKQLGDYGISISETNNILNKIQYLTSNGKYETMQWTFTITKNLGKLSFINIFAKSDNGKIYVSGSEKEYSTTIPKLTEKKTTCARTGNRKFGVAGPRSMECNDVIVERGITLDEIEEVQNFLIKSATNNMEA